MYTYLIIYKSVYILYLISNISNIPACMSKITGKILR